jgi:hypothetical protein
MCSVPTELPAARRARWLAELSEALDEAHRILVEMHLGAEPRTDASELYIRIEAARFEVQSLRLSRSLNPRSENGPLRTDFLP